MGRSGKEAEFVKVVSQSGIRLPEEMEKGIKSIVWLTVEECFGQPEKMILIQLAEDPSLAAKQFRVEFNVQESVVNIQFQSAYEGSLFCRTEPIYLLRSAAVGAVLLEGLRRNRQLTPHDKSLLAQRADVESARLIGIAANEEGITLDPRRGGLRMGKGFLKEN